MPGAAGALVLPQEQPRACTKACSSHAAEIMRPIEAVSTQHAPDQSKASQEAAASSINNADSKASLLTAHVAGSSGGACVKMLAGSKSVTAGGGLSAAAAAASAAFVAAKLGLSDQLESAVAKTPGLACLRDAEGRCCLHYAAGYGHEECVDLLLTKGGPEVVRARDNRGDLALHMAAQQGHPMCTYNLAKACTASCMARNKAGHSPIDVAAAAGRGEVLNAMLLACSGDGNSAVAVAAMRLLLAAGAVPDTWAPNGSSALMLAASANGVSALQVLLEGGATIELQDALGRSALMFAAGSDATAACNVLLEAHASLSARDRRGRAALDYAPAGSESAKLLQKRLDELESVASQLQQQLLQEGADTAAKPKSAKNPAAPATAGPASATAVSAGAAAAADGSTHTANSSSSKKKKKKKGGKLPAGVCSAAATAEADAECSGKGSSRSAAAAVDFKTVPAAAAGSRAFGARSFAAAVGPAAPEMPPSAVDCADRNLASSAAANAANPVDASGQRQHNEGVAAAEVLAAQEDEWHVVAPKSKHKPGPPSVHQASRGFRGHSGSSSGSSGGGLHQQVLLSAAGMAAAAAAASGSGGKHGTAAAAAVAARHRRQGSAHSICSTMSFASCDSSSCSAGSGSSVGCTGGSAASAGTQHRPGGTINSPRVAWGVAQQQLGAVLAGKQAAPVRALQQQQQQGASAADSSAAATGMENPTGFKAALLQTGQDASAPCACAVPAAASAAGLQVGGAKAHSGGVSSAADSNTAETCQKKPPAMGAVGDVPAGAPAAAAGAAAAEGCGDDVAAADDVSGDSSLLATQPEQQQEREVLEQDTGKEHQQQLQLLAAKLLQARADLAVAQQQLRHQVTAHQQQLATILEDAAAHEATAVQAAVEAAVVETLQSPLLLQVLSTGVQQAVLKERTGMQVKLLQYGLPAAAVLHILTQQQPPPPLAAGTSARGPGGPPAASNSPHEDDSADVETSDAAAPGADGSCANAHAAAAAVPSCAPLMAQMLSALSSNVLAASAGGGAAAQQQHMQQAVFLQRLRQQQQQGSGHAAAPELNLDIRSEYYGGGSAFVVPAKQQQDHRESAAEAILKLHTDRSSCDSHDELPAPAGGQRRSSSGCSTMSALDDAPVTDVAAAVGSFYGTIGCGGGANSSCSPHSSSGCSSAFGPAANVTSPAGGSLWGDASLVGSPALGTSPFLGPSALPLHGSSFSNNSYPGTHHSIPRTSPLGFASGCSAASAAARTQWGFQQPQKQGGLACGAGAQGRVGAAGDGRSSMDSSRLVDLLPDEL